MRFMISEISTIIFFWQFLIKYAVNQPSPPLLPKFLYFLSLIPIKLLLNIPLFLLSYFCQTIVKYPFISSLLVLSNYCQISLYFFSLSSIKLLLNIPLFLPS